MGFRNAKYAIAYTLRLNKKPGALDIIKDQKSTSLLMDEKKTILNMPEIASIPTQAIGKSRAYEMLFGWSRTTKLLLLTFLLCFLVWAAIFLPLMAKKIM